jgi:hypothetical protein
MINMVRKWSDDDGNNYEELLLKSLSIQYKIIVYWECWIGSMQKKLVSSLQ